MTSAAGFGLIELLVVLAIGGVLAMMAIPGLSSLAATQRIQAEQRELADALALARSEAVSRGRPVVLCRSTGDHRCTGTWSDGWMLFQDDGTDSSQGVAEERILRLGQPATARIVAYNGEGVPRGEVRFDREGYSSERLTFRLCGQQPGHARAVLLERTGRLALSRADEGGQHRDAFDHVLDCS